MPELPEVEAVRQSLDKKIKQKIVKKVIVKNRNLRFKVKNNFESFFKNQKIKRIERFSKYLILFLSNNFICLIHLGMSGTIHLIDKRKTNYQTNTSFYSFPMLPKKHNHIEFIFDDFRLVYNDPRRFGFFEILKNINEFKKRFKKFGPEPFNSEFNLKYIYYYLKGKKKKYKKLFIRSEFCFWNRQYLCK